MRGTLHLLPSDELPTWVAALSVLKPRYHAASWQRYYGLTREEAEAMLAAIVEALDERMLTREELAQEVGRHLGSEELGSKLRDGSSPGDREPIPGRLWARHARGVRSMVRHDLARAGREAHRGSW
ncbi:MAG TPA: crosslink repair DNA glycosylase YcaQ family protein [Rubrobacteraceae bacterium]|nr:crosslink repair DNA glycosylase YcaQ family protein [Rubrobacteraceae bacterium]